MLYTKVQKTILNKTVFVKMNTKPCSNLYKIYIYYDTYSSILQQLYILQYFTTPLHIPRNL